MAEVFLARPIGDPRSVVYALKCILPHFADDPRFVQMFHRELTIATGLCHPNLVSVLDHGREEGRHFMVMEYVHGADLAKLLRTTGEQDVRPPLAAALSVVLAVARGLHHLHEWPGKHGGAPGFVHRDVSPSNVLIGFDGSVKVADFGVATATAHTRTTDAGGVKGKMGYLSPEQCRSEALDRRSDVFALGVLLYESTLGERLFYAENDYAVMHQIVSAEYDPPRERDPEYPTELEAIVLKALASAKEDRFETAGAMADAIEAFAEAQGLTLGNEAIASWMSSLIPWEPYPAFAATPPEPPSVTPTVAAVPAPPPPSRWPMIAAIAVPASVGVLVAALVLIAGRDPDPPAPSPAPAAAAPAPLAAPSPQPPTPAPPNVPQPAAVDPDLALLNGGNAEFEGDTALLDPADFAEGDAEDPHSPAPTTQRRKKRRRKKPKSRRPKYDLDAPRPPQ